MDDNKNSDIEYTQRSQVKMEDFGLNHFLCNSKSKRQKQPLDESFKSTHASINPKPKDSKDDTKK
ncbi:hypothetical protein FIM73_05230 [Helicobacter pylori]|uniref:hypothetical protein n=1 Tax=Helicobacter pylori TaxID=210 RepID=UPI00112EAB73|nr:hypothetical protein [Helicobacter pylori]TPH46934.1 hypothetical protein FIM73_05230 [Helicobacter pylori]TPH72501.1 hypothetical protein FIM59_03480 [Helicobacter pylori]